MQINKFLLVTCLCLAAIFAKAQSHSSTISGKLFTSNGEAIPSATIRLSQNEGIVITDATGSFTFKNIRPGKHSIQIKAIGFKEHRQTIELAQGESKSISIKLAVSNTEMESVTITGRSAVKEANRLPYNITAIDAKKLYNSTLDISGALDRVAGVRVRESGGVGSNFNLSLNGFSGNRIRFFIDGIPMDNFGSSFQINNIPINLAERVEVYKGVVPMWLGSDALGGAINIVTSERQRTFVDASYSFGSFNTHRSVVNAGFTAKNGFTVELNAFQNYSDNNYKVKLGGADIDLPVGTKEITLRRFHDTYHNETAILNLGVVNKPYADKLLFGITLGQNYKEIQTGARMATVYGGWHTRGNIIMPSLKYKKHNLLPGLDVTLNANYNLGKERNIDTLGRDYDWRGNYTTNSSGGESSRQLYTYRNNNGLGTFMANYTINDKHSLALSNVFTTFNRKGSNPLNPSSDALEQPMKTNKNILGLGYTFNLNQRFSTTVFGKHIFQRNEAGSRGVNSSDISKFGYGIALSYYLSPDFQLRSSYELANRMPETNEIFGDVINYQANNNLKPEKSNNINVGFNYNFKTNTDNRFALTANAIYRHADNYIYTRFAPNQVKYIADNRDGVRTVGADAEFRYNYKDWLTAGATATWQYLQNLQKYDLIPGTNTFVPSEVYKDQMPNIPYLFGNADLGITLKNVGRKDNRLTIGYNLLYVHSFYLFWPSMGGSGSGDKYNIPYQLSHDINLVYSIKNGRYNIGLEGKNITDAILYDNFSLQKPRRGFYLNLRYFFNQSH